MIKIFTFFTALFLITGFIVIMVLMLYCCCIVSSLSDDELEEIRKTNERIKKWEKEINKNDHI